MCLVKYVLLLLGPNPIQLSGTDGTAMQPYCKGTNIPLLLGSLPPHRFGIVASVWESWVGLGSYGAILTPG